MATPAAAPMIGIDLCDVPHMQARLDARPELTDDLFTEGERTYCRSQFSPAEHFAGRWAAKEAVMKALGLDSWDPLEVEVVAGGADASLELHGDVAARAALLGVIVTISLTHTQMHAAAVALARPA